MIVQARRFTNKVDSGRFPLSSGETAVIGGGPEALDVAAAVKKRGGQPLVIYSFSREEMNSMARELEEAERQGIILKFETGVFGIVEEDGEISSLMCTSTAVKSPRESRRDSIRSSTMTPHKIGVSQVIVALGEKSNLNILPPLIQESGLLVIADYLTAEEADLSQTRTKRVPRNILRQMASGKRAALSLDLSLHYLPFELAKRFAVGRLGALSIQAYRMNREDWNIRARGKVVRLEDLNLAHFRKRRRIKATKLDKVFNAAQAVISARRCFNCGICTFCYKCYNYCPDLAVRMDRKNRLREIDYDHCKGCGICAEECPRAAIGWERE
jgi:2-oxoacid:acceptor oxidoreductase delta subunit (pyruvate/2-ketoisovalerate family)